MDNNVSELNGNCSTGPPGQNSSLSSLTDRAPLTVITSLGKGEEDIVKEIMYFQSGVSLCVG